MWYIIVGYFLINACAGESSGLDAVERVRRGYPQQQQQHLQQAQIQYRPLGEAPEGIRQILQYQQAPQPLVHIPVPPPAQLQPAPAQQQQQQQQYQHRPLPLPPQQQQLQQQQQLPLHGQQYSPKHLYGGPQQPVYKGIQRPLPQQLAQQQALQQQYTPQYRTNYSPQQQLQQPPSPNSLYRTPTLIAGPPAPSLGPYRPHNQQLPLQQQQQQQQQQQIQRHQLQFPKNLPPHIQNIIQSQRSYQG